MLGETLTVSTKKLSKKIKEILVLVKAKSYKRNVIIVYYMAQLKIQHYDTVSIMY